MQLSSKEQTADLWRTHLHLLQPSLSPFSVPRNYAIKLTNRGAKENIFRINKRYCCIFSNYSDFVGSGQNMSYFSRTPSSVA